MLDSPVISLSTEFFDFFIRCLSFYHGISQELETRMLRKCFTINLKKDDYLIKTGEVCPYFYFVAKGLLVGSNVLDDKPSATFFSFKGEFVASISGMYGSSPSEESVVALEDSQLIALTAKDVMECFETFPESNVIMRKIMESYLKKAHIRCNMTRLKQGIEKYRFFLKQFKKPKNTDMPVGPAASFLGIKPQTFLKMKEENRKIKDLKDVNVQLEQIEYQMNVKQVFRMKGITISRFAEALGIKPHKLSFLLNHYYNLNFNEFINQHRITFVKKTFMGTGSWQHLTVEGVGAEAGFSSRSSFFLAFKKSTGLTPADFAAKTIVSRK